MGQQAGLVDDDHRLGRRAVDEGQRHRRVRGMVDRSLALDDDPVAHGLTLLDEPLDRALHEVADQPVDGDTPALDHHPGLAGGDERARTARRRPPPCAAPGPRTSCRSRSPCRRSGSPACPARVVGRRPSPCARAAAGSRRSRVPRAAAAAANSGSSPTKVCSPDRTSRPAAMASRTIARHAAGNLPPVGAMPISRASGGIGSARASASVATIGMS